MPFPVYLLLFGHIVLSARRLGKVYLAPVLLYQIPATLVFNLNVIYSKIGQ